MAIETVFCKDVEGFLQTLNLGHPMWRNKMYHYWVYRGQANADWGLVPRVYRKGNGVSLSRPEVSEPLEKLRDQLNLEHDNLMDFVHLANELGLSLPGFGESLTRKMTDSLSDETFPPTEALELLALAQHHGVPTRLLDFSYNPLIASYFAVMFSNEMANKGQEDELSESIAVWAVDLTSVFFLNKMLLPVTLPYASNVNLLAQEGMFILDATVNESWRRHGIYKPLDDVLSVYDGAIKDTEMAEFLKCTPVIYRVILPRRFAKELLSHLYWKERISEAHLKPSYANVVRTISMYSQLAREDSPKTPPMVAENTKGN